MVSDTPSEVWLSIFEYLPEETLLQTRQVNKLICDLSTPILFRREYLGRKPPKNIFAAKAEGLLSTGYVKHIRELQISSTILADDDDRESENNITLLVRVLESCRKRLEKLTLRLDYAWSLPKKKNDVIFLRRINDILSTNPLKNVKGLHIQIGCADFTRDRNESGKRLHSRDILPVPAKVRDAPGERVVSPPFPALEYLKFSPDTKMGSPQLNEEIPTLVEGCTRLALRKLDLQISMGTVQIDQTIPCPIPQTDIGFLQSLHINGKWAAMSSTLALAACLPSLKSLKKLKVLDLVLKGINPASGNIYDWSQVFNACSGLQELIRYSFKGCKNDCHPWHYNMARMPYFVYQVPQSGERHTGFNSFWMVECDALERLRGIVEKRRMEKGMDVSWS